MGFFLVSTQEAAFNLIKYMNGTLNSRKIMGLTFQDIPKAFKCIHHGLLYISKYEIMVLRKGLYHFLLVV